MTPCRRTVGNSVFCNGTHTPLDFLSMMNSEYSGGCGCGAVRYRAAGQPSSCCFCHCESCRRASGAPFLAWITFRTDEFRVLEGKVSTYRSSSHAERGFCSACGTTLTYAHDARPGEIDLTTASFDSPEVFTPDRHIWVSDKLAWVSIDDGLRQFQGWSSEG